MLSYRRVHRYEVETDTFIRTGMKGLSATIDANPGQRPWVELRRDGTRIIRQGFSWDGASGPAIDTANIMQASLAHDVLYELITRGLLARNTRKAADEVLRRLCLRAGMSWLRATYIYWAVRLFGWLHI